MSLFDRPYSVLMEPQPLKMTPDAPERTKSNVGTGTIFGASGVDGTQKDSTRTAKNGAERTIIMGNSIAIYRLEATHTRNEHLIDGNKPNFHRFSL